MEKFPCAFFKVSLSHNYIVKNIYMDQQRQVKHYAFKAMISDVTV